MKAAPKEVQAGCGVSAITMGMPGPPIPGTPQLKTPPRLVRLITVPKGPISTQTVVVTSPSSLVPQTPIISMRQIQDKTPQTLATIKQQLSNMTTTASAWRASVALKRGVGQRLNLWPPVKC